jgi:hypothetical protein
MNKSVAFLFISYSLLNNFGAISMDKPKKQSCEEQLVTQCVGGNLERALATRSLKTRAFKPYALETFDEAKINFAKKGVIITKILVSLQANEHLVAVATRAKLEGLCIVQNDAKDVDGSVHDAFTGVSITQFKDGFINHAIAIPSLPDRIAEHSAKRLAIVSGIIEREIARISKAYTFEDDELIQWKHKLCTRIPYGICTSVLGFCFPPSLLVSLPLGYLCSSVQREVTQLSLEVATDRHAVELAQRADNLIATLETTNELMHESNIKEAEALKDGNCHLSQRVQRIHVLLEAQDELKKTK